MAKVRTLLKSLSPSGNVLLTLGATQGYTKLVRRGQENPHGLP